VGKKKKSYKNRPRYIKLGREEQIEVEQLAEAPGWCIIPKEKIPKVFPEDFREKMDSAVIVASGTPAGVTYLMCNARRVDWKDRAIDQEPFGIVVLPAGASTGGMFIHHGDWEGRTMHPPKEFWECVIASGAGNYFCSNPPTGKTSGSLAELPPGDKEAFERIIEKLKND